jgi:hypothetical protein
MTTFDASPDAADLFLMQHDPTYRPALDSSPSERPNADIATQSDTRQMELGELLVAGSRDMDADIYMEADIDMEEYVDAKTQRLRQRIERRGFFHDLTRACNSDAERRERVKLCLRQLEHTRAEDIRAAVVAVLDDTLASLHYPFTQRRDFIASRLGGCVETANKRVRRGHYVLTVAARMAAEQSDDTAESEPVDETPKRLKPDLRKATRNTMFDSDARRCAIASLSPEEQNAFVRLLERESVEGEIDAIDMADRASRITMLPHSFNRVLDDVGRSDDQSRRLLARMSPADRKALVADWVSEEIDAAISGTAEQRQAARAKYGSREYDRLVARFLEQRKARGAKLPRKHSNKSTTYAKLDPKGIAA